MGLRICAGLLLGSLLGALLAGCPPTISRPRADAYLDAMAVGGRHSHHGRYGEAAQAFEYASVQARRRVDRDEALYRLAQTLRRDRRYAQAVQILDRLAAGRPVSRRTVRALFDASLLRLHRLGQPEAGQAGLLALVRAHGDSGPAARALVLLLEAERARGGEAAILAFCEQLYPEVRERTIADDLLHAAARAHLELGERGPARAALERIVRDHPYPQGHRWDDAILSLAELDLEEGAPRQAIARLEAFLERAETTSIPGSYTLPTFARAQLQIARIHRDQLEDFEQAAEAFEAVYERFPHSRLRDDALTELGELWLDRGAPERGCPWLRRVVEEFEVGRARRRAMARLRQCGAP